MADIQVDHIVKTYNHGRVKALADVSFSVEKGQLFGLIGPDGAGKTSLFRILTTLLPADSGTAFVRGLDTSKDHRQIRAHLGYMPGRFSLYQDLTVEENLAFFAAVFGTTVEGNYDQVRDIYDQLKPFRTRPAGKLSGGMKQKLALCCALIHRPQVLFLDEPTTGVDVVSRKEFWEMLKRLKDQGISILVSTPYMDEATLCDRIALIQKGRIMSIDTPQGIIDRFPTSLYAARARDMYRLLVDFRGDRAIRSCYAFGEYLHLTLHEDGKGEAVFRELAARYQPQGLEVKRIAPTIEDSFMRLMGEMDASTPA